MRHIKRAGRVDPEEAVSTGLPVVQQIVDAEVTMHSWTPIVAGMQIKQPECRTPIRFRVAVQIVALLIGVIIEFREILRTGVAGLQV